MRRFFIDDTPGISVLELKAKARRLKTQHDIQLIAVDYLQLLETSQRKNRSQEISHISSELKSLAKELAIPVMVLTQLNRPTAKHKGHKSQIPGLCELGSIEKDAGVIILLHRDDYYNPKMNAGVAELDIAKQKNLPTGTIKLNFLSHYMRFEAHSPKNRNSGNVE